MIVVLVIHKPIEKKRAVSEYCCCKISCRCKKHKEISKTPSTSAGNEALSLLFGTLLHFLLP